MRILLTGASGLLGKHLTADLSRDATIMPIGRNSSAEELRAAAQSADRVIHLAGVTRPTDRGDFDRGNVQVTDTLINALAGANSRSPIFFSSSIRAAEDTEYGRTKYQAERLFLDHARRCGTSVAIYRLPSFFGRWSPPYYNSVVATFCYEIGAGRAPEIKTPGASLLLVHLDTVVATAAAWARSPAPAAGYYDVAPVFRSTVGEVADLIVALRDGDEGRLASADPGLRRGLAQTLVEHEQSINERPEGALRTHPE